MNNKSEIDQLAVELELENEVSSTSRHTPVQARVIAGFEDIVRFVDEHGRRPEHGDGRDIFERIYVVRLDRIRGNPEFRALVANLDKHGLLTGATDDFSEPEEPLDEAELLEALDLDDEDSITTLKHVKPRAEVQVAEDVADRKPCKDFAKFKPLFEVIQTELDIGCRETRRFAKEVGTNTDAKIDKGEFFILQGQIAYVAESGEEERRTKTERPDRRLRVIFDNGTESDMLMRSLQRALYKDEAGRRIIDPVPGPLFGTVAEPDDLESGTIYVLRSKSEHPLIAQHRELIHKIGVTGGEVNIRIGNAEMEPTYLFAAVEVVATYKLYNINRSKLENLLHRFFAPARLDFEIPDRFNRPVKPREWFLVPLQVIDAIVDKIRDGSISDYIYDPKSASLMSTSKGDHGTQK
jgi:hypothetical protein